MKVSLRFWLSLSILTFGAAQGLSQQKELRLVKVDGLDSNLRSVFTLRSDWAFAVGEAGTIAQYDGFLWKRVDSPVSEDLAAVWGSASEGVFAAGANGCVLRYENDSWTRLGTPTNNYLYGVWGSGGEGHVWIVGEWGTLLTWDRRLWSQDFVTRRWLRGIWSPGKGQVYVVGNNGLVLLGSRTHGWSRLRTDLSRDLFDLHSISGTSAESIFVVAERGRLLHFDGDKWRVIPLPREAADLALKAVWAIASNRSYVVGEQGLILEIEELIPRLISVPTDNDLLGVCGDREGRLTIVGNEGTILTNY